MRRKQLYITERQETVLKELAARHGKSEAEILREALERYVAEFEPGTRRDPLDQIIALGDSGRRDAAENHDAYLYRRDLH